MRTNCYLYISKISKILNKHSDASNFILQKKHRKRSLPQLQSVLQYWRDSKFMEKEHMADRRLNQFLRTKGSRKKERFIWYFQDFSRPFIHGGKDQHKSCTIKKHVVIKQGHNSGSPWWAVQLLSWSFPLWINGLKIFSTKMGKLKTEG